MGKCKITHVNQHSGNAVSPIIIGWDHGTLKNELLSSSVCDVIQNTGDVPSTSVAVTIKDGSIYIGDIINKPLCRTFIAVRNKSKKKASHSKVKLYEASSSLLVPKKQNEVVSGEFIETNSKEKFYKVFGSKKGIRHHETTQKMNIVAGVVRESLQQTLDNVKVDESEEMNDSLASGMETSILPPCNRLALTREDVYHVESIIPDDVMDEMETDAEVLMKMVNSSSPLSSDDYSALFIESVMSIKRSATVKLEPVVLKQKLKMLMFCELLGKLVRSKSELERSKKPLVLSPSLPWTNQFIMENYTVPNGVKRMLSTQNQDKVLCHMIILLLLSCGYVLDLKALCCSVPFASNKLGPVLQFVGATPCPGSDKKSFTLKTPLPPLPSMKRGQKRRR